MKKHDPLGPSRRPWLAEYETGKNQYGECGGRPIIRDASGKLVATFNRTIDRDLFMRAVNKHDDRWNRE